jgi:hypothetical protein
VHDGAAGGIDGQDVAFDTFTADPERGVWQVEV